MTELMIEKIAYVLCRNEVQGRSPRSIDESVQEVERVWKRFIPEAKDLVKSLSKAGIVMLMPAELPETSVQEGENGR